MEPAGGCWGGGGLKEQVAMIVRGNSSIDEPEAEKGSSCSLNSPLNREGAFVRWSGELSMSRVYVAVQLALTAWTSLQALLHLLPLRLYLCDGISFFFFFWFLILKHIQYPAAFL